MNGLVAVLLGVTYIILESAGERHIHLVHDTQSRIAVRKRIHDYPAGKHIVDLSQILTLVVHLLIDAVEMLGASVYVVMLDTVCFELLGDLGYHLSHEGFSLGSLGGDKSYEFVVTVVV